MIANCNKKHLLIIDDVRVLAHEQCLSSPNPMHNLWTRLASYFSELALCLPTETVSSAHGLQGTTIGGSSLSIRQRPFFKSPAEFWLKSPQIAWPTFEIVDNEIQKTDIVFLRIPSVISPIVVMLAWRHQKPLVLQVKGWWDHIAEATLQQKSVQNYIAYFTVMTYEWFHRRIAKRYPCLFMSQDDVEIYGQFNEHVAPINVSLMSEDDIYQRNDTCQQSRVQLLYVGRLAPTKGLSYLLEALAQLENSNIRLKIVGHGADEEKLRNLASQLKISNQVEFTGPLAHGKEIQEAYRESDIFVLPSLGEGFPKVLYEAAAAGLPIVSTNVGGIPEKMHHEENALLVESADSRMLQQAILKIINNKCLRKKLIRNNLKFATDNTLEKSARMLASFINTHSNSPKK